ncbi:hypothetical protein JRO89_XS07G0149600 [Xanthoceras sorbifolium]|uniref:Bifunctional inhibitor/plant lipid transfer protein/seed storage helical domain-containing protein n=1 Tax=Xanthoceras sorbifolium TaxID=99658 RepID=A0ABQ8HU36_9ROSI|nr:hypothetical protein JRO89_XS07G0149600 [Xanthoceras sorbifolium]
MATRILLVVCVMAALAAVANSAPSKAPSLSPSPVPVPAPSHSSSSPAPSPSDCSTVIYHMASCLSFLGNDSKVTKPDSSCCSGFKSVLHVGFECICTAVNSSARMGLALNMTKANTLPSACGVSAPPLTHCNAKPPVSPSHPSTPAKPPSHPSTPAKPPSHPSTPAKPPSAKTPGPQLAPSPSILSGTDSMTASLTLIISMLVASFSIVSA